MAAVGAGAGQHRHSAGDQGAILLETHFHLQYLWVPAARHEEFLPARVFDLHRPAGGQREGGADVLQQHLLLATEAAAHARFDDTHALDRYLQDHRHLAAGMERHLRAGADHQAVIRIEPRDRDVRLEHGMLLAGGAEFVLQHQVRRAEPVRDVAELLVNRGGDVVLRIMDAG